MATETQNPLQRFSFPSEYTINALIGPYPLTSDLVPSSAREKIIKATVKFFSNHTQSQQEIYTKVREIIIKNAPDLNEEKLNCATLHLTQSLMYIVTGHGRTLWDFNAPGRNIVLY